MASRGDRPEVGCRWELRPRWGAIGAAVALVAVVLAWSAPAGHPSAAAVATSPPTAAAAMGTPSPTSAPAPIPSVAAPPAARTRAADSPPPTAAATLPHPVGALADRVRSDAASPQTWALMVGIDRYARGDHDLRTAAADARDVDAALAGYGVASDHRMLLLDRDASAANIRGGFGWLTSRAAPDDVAVVFFAGHAAHVRGSGDRRGDVALIAADDVAVSQSELGRLLSPLRARSAWLAMAACYGAEFDGLLAPGRILTAAAGRDQLAYENDAMPHSYLVEYMVQRAMIDGAAPRSVEEAFGWARTEIARHYPGREPTMINGRSTPLVLGPARSHATRPAVPAPPTGNDRPASGDTADTAPPADPGDGPCTGIATIRLCHR